MSVETAQLKKAVHALLKHSKSKQEAAKEDGKTLFADEEESLWLVVSLKTMQPSSTIKLKPHKMYVLSILTAMTFC